MPWRLLTVLTSLLLGSCSSYYGQLAQGQWQLWRAQQPLASLIDDPDSPESLRQQLILVRDARQFAHEQLALPDNGSYLTYVELDRPYVVWNLLATEEFSIEPNLQCFPIAGCVAYRGYFDLNRARGAAALLKQQGMDTAVLGVEAYSTLGWLNDSLLSSMLRRTDEQLVAVIFHELAHQQYYLPDDTAFNESFASFVEQQGLKQWHPHGPAQARVNDEHRQFFVQQVLNTREQLAQLYQQPVTATDMRQAKADIFAKLREDYLQQQQIRWPDDARYRAWINSPLNNAKLLPVGLYDQWVPAFAQLFREQSDDWPKFYQAVRTLGQLPAKQRLEALQRLKQTAASRP